MPPETPSLADEARLLSEGRLRSATLVERALEGISRTNPSIGAFVDVFEDEARRQACAADERLARGGRAPLLGVPVAVKSDLEVGGHPTKRGLRSGRLASQDCPSVAALRRAGAIVVGTTAMSEAALWSTTTSVAGRPTVNPAWPERSPGGSSGGSAAAVAGGLVAGALGTDMGGSVRIPAACCGVVGFKPERDPTDSTPVARRWRGLRTVGYIAKTVGDCALLHDCLAAGPHLQREEFAREARIAASTTGPFPHDGVDEPNRAAVQRAANALQQISVRVEWADPPYGVVLALAVPRFLRAAADELADVDPQVLERRTREAKRIARRVPGRAADVSERLAPAAGIRLAAFFRRWDVLLCPAIAHAPPAPTEWSTGGAITAFAKQAAFAHTNPIWNVTGQPAITVPLPGASGEPSASVQLVGAPGATRSLLVVAAKLEHALAGASPRPGAAS